MLIPEITDFLLAYRKVKAELWHLRGLPNAKALLDYEADLLGNLQNLRERLSGPNFNPDKTFLGEVYHLPKKIHPSNGTNEAPEKLHFSKIGDKIKKPDESDGGKVSKRLVAVPSIDFQILGVLWIMEHGDWVDRKRSNASRANVLRRHYAKSEIFDEGEEQAPPLKGAVNKGYPGVYRPYFTAYKRWRSDGINKIRSALKGGQRVYALTLDLKGFYHQIDAGCLRDFITPGKFFSSKISDAFLAALEAWQMEYGEHPEGGNEKLGIPVGLIASALIANLVLHDLDEVLEEHLTPVYYGRYVDDFFLVLNLNGNHPTGESVLKELERLLANGPKNRPKLKFDEETRGIDFTYSKWKNSKFESKADKQRIFELGGDSGLDFLSVLEQATFEQSSEWRMVPDLDEDWGSQLAEALVVSRDASEEANTLRKADMLSLKRLGVSLALRKLEAIERFQLKAPEWREHREAFYKLLHSHVLTPEGICEFWPNFPRVWGLVLSQGDWDWANRFLLRIRESIAHLSGIKGGAYDSDPFWSWMARVISDEIYKVGPKVNKKFKSFAKRFDDISGRKISVVLNELSATHKAMRATDLGRFGVRFEIRSGAKSQKEKSVDYAAAMKAADVLVALVALGEEAMTFENEFTGPLKPLIFPTRPIGELELCLLSKESVDLVAVRNLCSALRGFVESPDIDADELETPEPLADSLPPVLGHPTPITVVPEFKAQEIKVAITNYHTTEAAWLARVRGKPDLSYARLKCLLQLVDEFLRGTKKLPVKEKPLYFFLPELSVPREWLMVISSYLSSARVSFIVGVEYEPTGETNQLINPAYLFLRSREFGFPCTVLLKRCKTRPAVGEEALLHKYGKTLKRSDPSEVPFYKHGDFHFAVLLCSELMDAEFQYHFREHVDAVVCLEWNPDLESFSALVESSALTMHAYIVQVNNREYGDSRVRSPAKQGHKRDIIRLRGGDHDYFVVGSLDIKALRDYQRAVIPDQDEDAKFKPTPPGFDHANPRLK